MGKYTENKSDHALREAALSKASGTLTSERLTPMISKAVKQLLNDPTLLAEGSFINGLWHQSESTFCVQNPFDKSDLIEVSEVSDNGEMALVEYAVQAAHKAQLSWASKTSYERYELMMAWHDLMIEHKEDLATIMTLEQGKPLKESRGEIDYGASYVKWFAEEGKRVYGDTIPALASHQEIKVIKQPVGVVAAVTPWNFPNSMLARKIAPAIAAGNTVVARPSEQTPLSALALGVLAERADIPAGVINIVVGSDSKGIGKVLTEHPLIDKFSFTGSTKVGQQLMQQCASTVKKVSLELGGNAPFIVFADADIDAAIEGAIKAKYRNAGQTCVCVNRFLVEQSIRDEFIDKFVEATSQLKVANGLQDDVDIGPLIHDDAAEGVRELVQSALREGASMHFGDVSSTNLQGPIVLSDVTNDMDIAKNEIFGPVAAIQAFTSEEEAVAIANDTEFGLAAYFYSQNIKRINRVAQALKYGMVGINEGIISNAAAPFGGIKQSGFGREGSKYGLDDYMNMKYLCFNHS